MSHYRVVTSSLHVILILEPVPAAMSGTGIAMGGRRAPLIPAEARELAAELVRAADELEFAKARGHW